MKQTRKAISIILILSMMVSLLSIIPFTALAQEEEVDYTQYVDPFVGTDVDYGQLFPGSVVPYGLVKLSPDTYPHSNDDHAGYDYTKTQIQGFSHTRIEGVGGQGAGGDVLITPTYVTYTSAPASASKAQSYVKATETATPGYYSVELVPNTGSNSTVTADSSFGNILAEMTTATRTGYHRYTLPKDGDVSLIVDLNYTYHGTDVRNAILDVVANDAQSGVTTLAGRFTGKNVGGNGRYTMYFYMETSQPVKSYKTWNGSSLSSTASQAGNNIGAVLTFAGKKDTPIEAKVSISTISAEQAKIDMYNEIPNWNFAAARQNAKKAWNDVLGKVKVTNSAASDPDDRLIKLFYTHLYHMFTTPVNATSTSGTFRATDGTVCEADGWTYYDSWTLWDDFRKYPLVGLVLPDVYKDLIRSLATTMEHGYPAYYGLGLNTNSVPTVRYEHAVALLADGIAKGFTDIPNLEAAYKAAKSTADSVITSNVQRMGYVDGRVDRTVEFSYDDWCISLLAEYLGKTEDQQNYLARSFYYKNLYKADAVTTSEGDVIGLLWPKDSSGNWKTANPEQYGNNSLYQGTLWQYTWWDTNDVLGLMNLMGGKANMYKALSRLYGEQDPDNGKAMLHTNTNEIDLQTPYLFNFVGRADRTQYWVRKIYSDKTWNRYSGTGEYNPPKYDYVYKLEPNGFLQTMDDDAGTMAAMYVSAALGIFPMTPGDTTFQTGSPFFESVELDVGNGKTFTIKANNVSADNFYVQSASLNGVSFDRTWVDYSEIIRGGVLEFNMGSNPSNWASNGVTAFSSSEYTPTNIYSNDAITFSALSINESDDNDGSFDEVINISSAANFAGEANEDLIASGKVTVTNLPAGLTAKAILKDSSNIELSLLGNAVNHSLNDCVSNVGIKLNNSLFANAVTSAFTDINNFKVMFRDDYLTFSKDVITETYNGSGVFNDTLEIKLVGTASFTGTNGEDYITSGKLSFANLPANLSASAVKTADDKVTVTFTGTNVNNGTDDMIITFADSAFSNGKASKIENSNYGGMRFIKISVFPRYNDKLAELVAQAKLITNNNYSPASYQALQTAIATAEQRLAQTGIDQALIKASFDDINSAISGLKVLRDGYAVLEAEDYDVWSGGALKTETSTDAAGNSLGNIGATYPDAWVAYEALDFGDEAPEKFVINYSNNSGRCAPDATYEIRLGAPDGQLIQTIPLEPTGNGWQYYSRKTFVLNDASALTGVQDVYFVMRGTTTTSNPYIMNLDYVQFVGKEIEYKKYGKYEAENYDAWSENGLKTETNTDANGASLVNLGGTYDGAWIEYKNFDFDGDGLGKFAIRYASNSGRCGENSYLEIRLDDPTTGTVAKTVEIPYTASNWNGYTVVNAVLDEPVTGKHNVYIVLHSETTSAKPFIANIDYFEFIEADSYKTYGKYEAESYDAWSGGGLKTETSTDSEGASLKNLGGTYDGAWLKFGKFNFDGEGFGKFTIRYSSNSGRCGANSYLELRLDDPEDGELFQTVEIPYTGSNWNLYNTLSVEFDDAVKGIHDVYVVLHSETTSAKPYIANIDYFEFNEAEKYNTYGRYQAENYDVWSAGTLKTETSKDAAGASLGNIGATYDGAWVGYKNFKFTGNGFGKFTVRYVNNSSRCGSNAYLEIRLDDPTTGELVKTVDIPATGSNWNAYGIVTAELDEPVKGKHDVYVIMHTEVRPNYTYVGNFDYFEFNEAELLPKLAFTSAPETVERGTDYTASFTAANIDGYELTSNYVVGTTNGNLTISENDDGTYSVTVPATVFEKPATEFDLFIKAAKGDDLYSKKVTVTVTEPPLDFTALDELYNASLSVLDNEKDYSISSFAAFEQAMTAANAVLTAEETTQEAIDSAYAALAAAVDDLTEYVYVYSVVTDAPAYIKGTVTTFTVETSANVEKLAIANETGRYISAISSEKVVNGDRATWTLTGIVETKGNRSIYIYAARAEEDLVNSNVFANITIDIAVPQGEDAVAVSSVKAPETALVDEAFAISVNTTTSATKVGIFDANTGKALGKISQSYVDNNGVRKWIITLKIGTKGNRSFNVKATDSTGVWSDGVPFDIVVNK